MYGIESRKQNAIKFVTCVAEQTWAAEQFCSNVEGEKNCQS